MLPSRPPPIPLNLTRIEIFLQIQERGLLKTPNPMKTCSERCDKRRYYRFYREHGHDTEECRDLQSQIENLIWHGHLRRYVRDQLSLPDSQPPRDPSPRPKGPVEKQIGVIIGGPASGSNSSLARKAYACTEVGKRPVHEEDLDITFCHDSRQVWRRTKVENSDGVIHGDETSIGIQRQHRMTDPQPTQGGHFNLPQTHEVPDLGGGGR
ncbi:hypothetical protein B296_00055017, partial [Ensete ventricosum]